MTNRKSFGEICRGVCEQQGWDLLPGGIRVSWGDGRHQLVSLEFFEFEREQLVRLSSIIGDAGGLSPVRLHAALRINAELAHGALALKSGNLVVTDTLMLEDSDPSEIEASISYLAHTADYYEKQIFGTDEH